MLIRDVGNTTGSVMSVNINGSKNSSGISPNSSSSRSSSTRCASAAWANAANLATNLASVYVLFNNTCSAFWKCANENSRWSRDTATINSFCPAKLT